MGEVDRTIIELEAAGAPAEFNANLARAQTTLSDAAVSSRMADTSARHTAEKLETLVKQETDAVGGRDAGMRSDVTPGAGFVNQPTHVFMIKGTTAPSVVPTSPSWSP